MQIDFKNVLQSRIYFSYLSLYKITIQTTRMSKRHFYDVFRYTCLKDIFMTSLRHLLDMRVVWAIFQFFDEKSSRFFLKFSCLISVLVVEFMSKLINVTKLINFWIMSFSGGS